MISNIENSENKFKNVKLSLELVNQLEVIAEYIEKVLYLTDIHSDLLSSSLNYIKYMINKKRKEHLIKEVEFIKIKSKNAEFNAKKDLLNKLDLILANHKKDLNYLSKDFLRLKSQNDKKIESISQLEKEIDMLVKKKKEVFEEINKIVIDLEDENLNSRPKSKTIKALQKDAREYQYKIKMLKNQLEVKRKEYENFYTNFKKINGDYLKLKKIIKQDEEKSNSLQNELKGMLQEFKDYKNDEDRDYSFEFSKSEDEILKEIKSIERNLKSLTNSNKLFRDNISNLSETLKEEISSQERVLNDLLDHNIILERYDEIIASTVQFFKLESFLSSFENTLNDFLLLINLRCKFELTIDNDSTDILFLLSFIRLNKEYVEFQNLTTPEKVFFLVSFYLSYQINTKNYDILFCNLQLPPEFNKRGSIFRSIRKISKLFQTDKKFNPYRLIFMISSFLPKNPIENIKIIEIK